MKVASVIRLVAEVAIATVRACAAEDDSEVSVSFPALFFSRRPGRARRGSVLAVGRSFARGGIRWHPATTRPGSTAEPPPVSDSRHRSQSLHLSSRPAPRSCAQPQFRLSVPHSFLRASAAGGDADGAAAVVASSSAPDDARHRDGGRRLQDTTPPGTSTCTGSTCTLAVHEKWGSTNLLYGLMFDVKALTDIIVTGIIYYPSFPSSPQIMSVYTAPCAYSGIRTDSSAWTEIVDDTAVTFGKCCACRVACQRISTPPRKECNFLFLLSLP